MPSAQVIWVAAVLSMAGIVLLFVEIALLRSLTNWTAPACLQLHLATFAVVACLAEVPPGALLTALIAWPVVAPLLAIVSITHFPSFLLLPVSSGVAASIAAAAAFKRYGSSRIAGLWPTVCVVSFGLTALAAGELVFRQALFAAAHKIKADCVDAGTILEALIITQQEFASGPHARARRGDANFIWSFSEMDLVAAEPGAPWMPPMRRFAAYPSCSGRS